MDPRIVAQVGPKGAGGTPDLQGMLLGELADGREIDVRILGHGKIFHLPEWPPVHLGPVTLDLSPTKHTVFAVLAAVLLLAVLIPVGQAMRKAARERAPTGFANAVEAMVVFFRDEVVRPCIGEGADAYTPYILSLFFFVLTMNLLGLVPFLGSATGNLSVTGALAVVSFLVVEISGMVKLGFAGYMRTVFYAPPGMGRVGQAVMLLILTPVEFLSKLTKPFALMIRLFANMTAGHALVFSLLGMIFMFSQLVVGRWVVAGASVGMVSAFLILELFVAFLQAYIFAMLTAVFIGLIRHAH